MPCVIQYNAMSEDFELRVQGKEFNKIYEDLKKQSTIDWKTAQTKRNPF